MMNRLYITALVLLIQACTHINPFPLSAQPGETISLMIGSSENARKETIDVLMTDSNNVVWDMKSLGQIRSVFNVRPDGNAKGLYYSSYLETNTPWAFGHEPIQTVVVLDLPVGIAQGPATFEINTNTTDNSSGVGQLLNLSIEIVADTATSNSFLHQNPFQGISAVDFDRLEPASYAKISFGVNKTEIMAAATLEVDFDETVVSPDDIAVYTPKTTVRDFGGSFDDKQHSVFWKQDGDKLLINLVAANGIKTGFVYVYIIHPDNLSASPGLSLISHAVYDIDGNEIVLPVTLEYVP